MLCRFLIVKAFRRIYPNLVFWEKSTPPGMFDVREEKIEVESHFFEFFIISYTIFIFIGNINLQYK